SGNRVSVVWLMPGVALVRNKHEALVILVVWFWPLLDCFTDRLDGLGPEWTAPIDAGFLPVIADPSSLDIDGHQGKRRTIRVSESAVHAEQDHGLERLPRRG